MSGRALINEAPYSKAIEKLVSSRILMCIPMGVKIMIECQNLVKVSCSGFSDLWVI